ncbi:MAG: 16S rRNA (guanine(527)-N(7))-methyltransferase RsmG [Rhodospirillaceae bacterium]|nr:16S rRNA (guanine(527)-N(7))-methyltransferase RsmG [Rhodospirillaceae bacterium]
MKQSVFTADDFQTATGVSRETLIGLKAYVDTLIDWNSRVNLVARSTIEDVWHRHVLDSAQLYQFLPRDASVLVDLGSGAGFPGLVLAIMGVPEVHLIESTGKKASFLRAAADAAGVSVKIHNRRIEALEPFTADVITARALAPLDKLLSYAQPFTGPHTLHYYLKGQHVGDELTKAHKIWNMKVDRQSSSTDPRGSVLSVREVSSVQSDRIHSPSSPSV